MENLSSHDRKVMDATCCCYDMRRNRLLDYQTDLHADFRGIRRILKGQTRSAHVPSSVPDLAACDSRRRPPLDANLLVETRFARDRI